MNYKVKLENNPGSTFEKWKATLYEDPPGDPLLLVAVVFADTREEALAGARQKRDAWETRCEPEWLTMDDVPEPQSLKAV